MSSKYLNGSIKDGIWKKNLRHSGVAETLSTGNGSAEIPAHELLWACTRLCPAALLPRFLPVFCIRFTRILLSLWTIPHPSLLKWAWFCVCVLACINTYKYDPFLKKSEAGGYLEPEIKVTWLPFSLPIDSVDSWLVLNHLPPAFQMASGSFFLSFSFSYQRRVHSSMACGLRL